jgi:hypothetical protein
MAVLIGKNVVAKGKVYKAPKGWLVRVETVHKNGETHIVSVELIKEPNGGNK